jgi:arylsulfatase A-like enzyme
MFPAKHGAHELHRAYAHAYPLLPEVLREVGYATVGVSPNSWMSDEFGVTHGFEEYRKLWQLWPTLPDHNLSVRRPWARLQHQVNRLYGRHVFPYRNRARHVTRHLQNALATAPTPFFAYGIYWDMHLPYTPHGRHASRWWPAEVDRARVQQVNRDPWRYLTGQATMHEEDFVILQALYDAALASIDEEIGTLVAWLRQHRMLDQTVVIITSDHGENLGEHGLMSHAYSLHDTLIHVPLIIRYPECFAAGTRVRQQVQLTDLFPTVMDVLHLDFPLVRQELQGQSLLDPVPTERQAYAELLAPQPSIPALNRRTGSPVTTPRPAFDRALRCLRTSTTKLIWSSDGQHALYDLCDDPQETTNRFTTEPALAATMLATLDAWRPPAGLPLNPVDPAMDEPVRQRLRALGYLT